MTDVATIADARNFLDRVWPPARKSSLAPRFLNDQREKCMLIAAVDRV